MALILNNVPEGFDPDEAEDTTSNGTIENAQEQEETTVTETEGQEQVVEEVQEQQDDGPDEPSDNKTRSKLGREVAALKESNKKLMDTVSQLLQSRQKDPADVETDDDPDRLLTVRELEDRERRKVEGKKTYDATYSLEIAKFKDEDGDFYQEIYDEWFKNHNVTYTNFKNPLLDARTAYNEARAVVLKSKYAAKTTKFNKTPGARPQAPTTPSVKTPSPKVDIPDLSDEARELAAYYGWDQDKVKQVLGGPSKVMATSGGKA